MCPTSSVTSEPPQSLETRARQLSLKKSRKIANKDLEEKVTDALVSTANSITGDTKENQKDEYIHAFCANLEQEMLRMDKAPAATGPIGQFGHGAQRGALRNAGGAPGSTERRATFVSSVDEKYSRNEHQGVNPSFSTTSPHERSNHTMRPSMEGVHESLPASACIF